MSKKSITGSIKDIVIIGAIIGGGYLIYKAISGFKLPDIPTLPDVTNIWNIPKTPAEAGEQAAENQAGLIPDTTGWISEFMAAYGHQITGGEQLVIPEDAPQTHKDFSDLVNKILGIAAATTSKNPFTAPISPIINAALGSAKTEYNKALTTRTPIQLTEKQAQKVVEQIAITKLEGDQPKPITLERLASRQYYGTTGGR